MMRAVGRNDNSEMRNRGAVGYRNPTTIALAPRRAAPTDESRFDLCERTKP
jgi:hypothetical protein